MLNALHPGKINETTKATQAEAVAGADNRKYMTPLRTKQVVDVVVDDVVEGALPAAIDTALAAASPVFDDVLSVASVEALPNPGVAGKLYIVGKLSYHWNGTAYDQIGSQLDNTDELSEGTTNLYFTDERAKAALDTELTEIGSDITELTGKTEQLETDLSSEVTTRAAADSSLSGGLNDLISALSTEAQARAAGDSSLAGGLAAEATARATADSALGGTITALASAAQPKNLAASIEVKAVTQGAYSDGTTIPAGTPVEEVLRKMLQTRVPATYAAPTLSISSNFGTQAEIGSSYSGTITVNWQQRDAGSGTNAYLRVNGVQAFYSPSGPSSAYSISSRPLNEAESWQLTTSHAAGPQKLDNFGDPSGTPIAAGSISSNTLTITPVRRIFLGASTDTAAPTTSAQIRALATSALAPANGSTYTLTLPAGTRRAVIAYPATLRAVSSVKYVELGNAEVRDTFTESTIQVDGAASGQNATAYRVYTYISAIPLGAAATYTITI